VTGVTSKASSSKRSHISSLQDVSSMGFDETGLLDGSNFLDPDADDSGSDSGSDSSSSSSDSSNESQASRSPSSNNRRKRKSPAAEDTAQVMSLVSVSQC
jgi:hypothetical protein